MTEKNDSPACEAHAFLYLQHVFARPGAQKRNLKASSSHQGDMKVKTACAPCLYIAYVHNSKCPNATETRWGKSLKLLSVSNLKKHWILSTESYQAPSIPLNWGRDTLSEGARKIGNLRDHKQSFNLPKFKEISGFYQSVFSSVIHRQDSACPCYLK